jgi:hypothetical protein
LTRRFAKGELDVRVGSGSKVVAIEVGTSSCFEEVDGYEIIIKNKHCSIYYNDIFYAHCPLVKGLNVLDLEDKSICNINMKRARLNDLNPTFI